jgi:hypothetical protein
VKARLNNGDRCKEEIMQTKSFRREVPIIVDELVAS